MRTDILLFALIIATALFVSACTTDDAGVSDVPSVLNLTNDSIQDQSMILSLEYYPMQCEDTPWASWLANSSIRFIMAPTEKQVIMMYYSNVYDITVLNVTQISTSQAVCEACGVCSKGYTLVAEVFDIDAQPLIDEGWKKK